MRGVRFEDLLAIVDFLYFGETNVFQENLDSFLSIAEELQLKGLMGKGGVDEVMAQPEPVPMPRKGNKIHKKEANDTKSSGLLQTSSNEKVLKGGYR